MFFGYVFQLWHHSEAHLRVGVLTKDAVRLPPAKSGAERRLKMPAILRSWGVEMTRILLITFNPAIFATCAQPAASCFQPVNLGSNLLLIDLSGSGWEQISRGVRSVKEFHLWQGRREEKIPSAIVKK